MNQFIALGILLLSMTFEFVRTLSPKIPGVFSYFVDLVIAAIAVLVVIRIIALRSWILIPAKYIFVFFGFVYVCVAGVILNDVSGDTTIAGTRVFLRNVPIFLLPFAFDYDSTERRRHLALLSAVMVLQIPITIWQRFVEFEGYITGDGVVGTFASSSALAVLTSVGVIFAVVSYLNGRMRLRTTLLLSLAMIIPTSLAETKVTPILLIIGGGAVLWVMRRRITLRNFVTIVLLGTIGLGLFVSMYALLYSREDGAGYFEVMTDPRYTYTYMGAELEPLEIPRRTRDDIVGQHNPTASKGQVPQQIGRADGMIMPFKLLLHHAPMHLALGLGIGNISTDFGSGGDYWEYHDNLEATGTTISHLLWETGICGLLLFVLFLSFVTYDCLKASKTEGDIAEMGAAMFATSSIVWVCLAYTSLFFAPEIMTPFCYLSGLVIATLRRKQIQDYERQQQSQTLSQFPKLMASDHLTVN